MATLSDVAKKASVSLTTASFVLNNRGDEMRISADTIKRVYKAAEALKYTGNYHARTLLRGRTQTLGLIMPPMHQHMVFMQLYEGLLTEARHLEYDMLQITKSRAETALERGMRYIRERRIDGLVSFDQPPKSIAQTIIKDKLPVCFICMNKPAPCSHVFVNAHPGIHQAVHHLNELGHREILYILRMRTHGKIATPDRFDAAMEEAEKLGLKLNDIRLPSPPRTVKEAGDFISYYHRVLSEYLPDPVRETAVFCYNDKMAVALCMVLQQRKIRVPEDISVIGFDDTLAAQSLPPLTTISRHYHKMGVEAIREVVAQFEHVDEDRKPETIILPSELVVRKSTGPR